MDRKKSWINALLLVATLAVNTLGGLGIINGTSQKEVSDRYPSLITPSSLTFSIWSLIYALLILSIIVMLVKNDDRYYQRAVDSISPLFWLSCVLNMAWIISFSYVLVELSVLFIFALVITLALICQKLLHIQEHRRWLLPLSFGLYTGWLFIATVVNIAAMLVKLEWDRFSLAEETWAMIILVVAIILVAVVLVRTRNAALPLPIAWAYFGIHQNLVSTDGHNAAHPLLEAIAIGGIIILIALAGYQFYRNRMMLLPEFGHRNEAERRS